MSEIDNLQIKIGAETSKASAAIDRLVGKLDRLTISLGKIDGTGSNLNTLSVGVQRLSSAMQMMNSVKTADFTRLARNLQTLNNIDVSKISSISSSIRKISTAFMGLSGMDKSAEQITMLSNGIKQLGYKSADKAILNIPLLADAVKKLMTVLSTAPKVSNNVINMTNALARLARTGASSGRAANSLSNAFNKISKSSSGMKVGLLGAVSGITAIRRSILQAMGVAGGFYAIFQGLKNSVNIASDLIEVQNVVDVTFGKYSNLVEEMVKTSIPQFGMSELTTKQVASRFQAMGTAMGFAQNKMADMSINLTKLTADMASFYNVEQKDVAKNLQSVFTGETEPLRKYGLDLTNATIQEWANKKGIDAKMASMSQAQKTMLRYQYVIENTSAAQGDFARTADTWANQTRVLKQNLEQLASIIGGSLINALKPLVKALNTAMQYVISFAKVVSDSLGKIFGWKYEESTGGFASDFEDAASSAGDLSDKTGKAADNAKKLKQQLQGIDELNVLTTSDNAKKGSGSGNGGSSYPDAQPTYGGQWKKTDALLDYESQLDTLYKLGAHIGDTIKNSLNAIDWNSVYQGAKNFGSGLASFLNGLISPDLFSALGKTIAASLNTALYSLNSFGTTFDWEDFGLSIATGINSFFDTFDFANFAKTINVWVDGVATTLKTSLKNISWGDVIKGGMEFLTNLSIETVTISIGAFAWMHGGKEIIAGALNALLSKQIALGIGDNAVSISTAIKLSLVTSIVGFKIGNWLYENSSGIQGISEAISKWITKDGTEISIARAITVSITGLAIAIPAAVLASSLVSALSGLTITGVKLALTNFAINVATGASVVWSGLQSVGSSLVSALVPIFQSTAGTIVSGLFAGIATAIAGWNIGQWLYDQFSNQIDGIAFSILDFFTKKVPQTVNGMGIAIAEFGIKVSTKVDDVKQWWINRAAEWKDKTADFKARVETKAGDVKQWWINRAAEWKDKTVKFKINAYAKVEQIKNDFKKVINTVIGWINKYIIDNLNKISINIPKVKIAGKEIFAGKKLGFNVAKIQAFEKGGFPEDGWFRASRGEIMGKFDNGQSVVANNYQITSGISSAVQKGNQQMIAYMQQEISELRTQNQLLTGILNKETGIVYTEIGKASQKYAREYTQRTGSPAYI